MQLAYVAHSERCALLLDEDGICRWFVPKVDDGSVVAGAKRCIGAQFVATLDPEATGLLGHDPSVGKSILLARVDDGRVSLVRFGPLVQFDTLGGLVDREASPAPPAPPPELPPELPEPKTAELPRLVLVPDFVADPRASEDERATSATTTSWRPVRLRGPRSSANRDVASSRAGADRSTIDTRRSTVIEKCLSGRCLNLLNLLGFTE